MRRLHRPLAPAGKSQQKKLETAKTQISFHYLVEAFSLGRLRLTFTFYKQEHYMLGQRHTATQRRPGSFLADVVLLTM